MKYLIPLLLLLAGCSKPTVVYVDSEGKPLKKSSVMMKHMSPREIFCVNGHQAYKMGYSSANAYLWVPVDRNSKYIKTCDKNTKDDGTQL